jgi:hypothetical protein
MLARPPGEALREAWMDGGEMHGLQSNEAGSKTLPEDHLRSISEDWVKLIQYDTADFNPLSASLYTHSMHYYNGFLRYDAMHEQKCAEILLSAFFCLCRKKICYFCEAEA